MLTLPILLFLALQLRGALSFLHLTALLLGASMLPKNTLLKVCFSLAIELLSLRFLPAPHDPLRLVNQGFNPARHVGIRDALVSADLVREIEDGPIVFLLKQLRNPRGSLLDSILGLCNQAISLKSDPNKRGAGDDDRSSDAKERAAKSAYMPQGSQAGRD